jgi:DNA-binding NarL/FixJ family response regulator
MGGEETPSPLPSIPATHFRDSIHQAAMITTLIAEDQPTYRIFLRRQLEKSGHFTIVGEAQEGPAAVAMIETLRPQLAILDIQMPGLNGIEAAEIVNRTSPGTVVMLMSSWREEDLGRVLKESKAGFINKLDLTPATLLAAYRKATG